MTAALITIATSAIAAYLGFRIGRADGEKRAAFEKAFTEAKK